MGESRPQDIMTAAGACAAFAEIPDIPTTRGPSTAALAAATPGAPRRPDFGPEIPLRPAIVVVTRRTAV